MLIKKLGLLVFSFSAICCASLPVVAQGTTHPRCEKLGVVVFEGDMAAFLSQVAEHFKSVIGLETISSQSKRTIKIDTCFANLDDIVSAVVNAAPEYQWRNRDGFIDVYPKEAGLPLLDSTVPDFQLNNTDWAGAAQALTNLIEAQSQLTPVPLTSSGPVSGSRYTPVIYFSLNLKDVTVRRALHETAKSAGSHFWMFQRFGKDGQSFAIKNSFQ